MAMTAEGGALRTELVALAGAYGPGIGQDCPGAALLPVDAVTYSITEWEYVAVSGDRLRRWTTYSTISNTAQEVESAEVADRAREIIARLRVLDAL